MSEVEQIVGHFVDGGLAHLSFGLPAFHLHIDFPGRLEDAHIAGHLVIRSRAHYPYVVEAGGHVECEGNGRLSLGLGLIECHGIILVVGIALTYVDGVFCVDVAADVRDVHGALADHAEILVGGDVAERVLEILVELRVNNLRLPLFLHVGIVAAGYRQSPCRNGDEKGFNQ